MRYLPGPVDLQKNNVQEVDPQKTKKKQCAKSGPPTCERKTMCKKWALKKSKKNNVQQVDPQKVEQTLCAKSGPPKSRKKTMCRKWVSRPPERGVRGAAAPRENQNFSSWPRIIYTQVWSLHILERMGLAGLAGHQPPLIIEILGWAEGIHQALIGATREP